MFHVTTGPKFESIRDGGAILANPPEPCEYDAYFRSIGCISLCDLRLVSSEDLETALSNYFFLNPRFDANPAFLILGAAALKSVVTYSEAREAALAMGKMIVPTIEAGFPGDLLTPMLDEVIVVDILRPPALESLIKSGGRR